MILGTEWCELGCEESNLDLYLTECRNACNLETNNKPKNILTEYLNCMRKSCLQSGVGPIDQIIHDDSWIECSQQCNREEMLSSHSATEKPVFHTQYLSDKQYENFKVIQRIESKVKKQNLRIKNKRQKNAHKKESKFELKIIV